MESIFSVKTGVVFSDNDAAFLLPEICTTQCVANRLGMTNLLMSCELVSDEV